MEYKIIEYINIPIMPNLAYPLPINPVLKFVLILPVCIMPKSLVKLKSYISDFEITVSPKL